MGEHFTNCGVRFLVDDEDDPFVQERNWGAKKEYHTTYIIATSKNSSFSTDRLPRLILNVPSNMVVDHINGDGTDNRRCNIRVCTQSENQWNRKPHKKAVSKFKGVAWKSHAKSFEVTIQKHKKRYFLGHYKNEELAAYVYDYAAKSLFGEFARTNEV